MTEPVRAAWNRFWFAPQATSTAALVRIWFGLVTLAWAASLAPDLGAFFSSTGLLPRQPGGAGLWGVLGIAPSDASVQIVFTATIVASLALIVGFQTRLASAVVFVAIMSFERRDPFVFNGGDSLLRIISFYLILIPSGAALSVDRWRADVKHFWEFPERPLWGLRLLQIQLSVVYLSTLSLKLRGVSWNDGTAVSYVQRLTDVARFPTPSFLSHSALLANVLTWSTLAVEASVPVLIWNRRLRPYVAVIGIALHLSIEMSLRVGFFTFTMLTLYLSFVSPRWAAERLRELEGRLVPVATAWLGRSRASSTARSSA